MTFSLGDGSKVATPADLTAAREARGLTLLDASQRMRFSVRQLTALEQGQWDTLPGATFVRGALRGYGRLLGVDVELLIETLGDAGRPTELRPAVSLSEPMPRADGLDFSSSLNGRRNRILLIVVCLAALAAFALFYGRSAPNLQGLAPRPGASAMQNGSTQAAAGVDLESSSSAVQAAGSTVLETVPTEEAARTRDASAPPPLGALIGAAPSGSGSRP
jgi:cytoskeleton protein RodZ